MKRLMAALLLLVLVASFATGLLLSRAEATTCTTFCDSSCDGCGCHKIKCCDGVCVVQGGCPHGCPPRFGG